MPDAKRPDPRKKASPGSRPGKPGAPGATGRTKPRPTARRVAARPVKANSEAREDDVESPAVTESIREVIATSAEQAAEQRFGSTARRAAILAAVVCVLTLTIAGPVRTYFGQRTEMKQLRATESQLREQIAELEQQKDKLADPVFIAAQARERLGFVMPGETPYQVQLPEGAAAPGSAAGGPTAVNSGDPWYTSLWHTIADAPHGGLPTSVPTPPGAPGAPEPVAPGAPPPGG